MPARFAQHLVARGLLPAQTVDEAMRRREAAGGTLDTALLEARALPEASLLQALAESTGIQPIDLAEFEPNPEMARFIPANVAGRLCAVPLSEEEQKLHVACAYPPPQRALEDVAVLLGKKLELWIALEARVRDWIGAVYGMEIPPRYVTLLGSMDPGRRPAPNGRPAEPAAAPAPAVVIGRAEEEPIPLSTPKRSDRVVIGEASNLEEALTRDMVEQIARAVAEEPILLDVRKRGAPDGSANREEQAAAAKAPSLVEGKTPAARPGGAPQPKTKPPNVVVFPPKPSTARSRPTPPAPMPAVQTSRLSSAAAIAPPPLDAEWTLAQARAALKEASQDRDQIIQVALHFARTAFDFVAAFAVVRGSAVGWAAEGEGAEGFRRARASLPLDAPSAFRTVATTHASYIGPAPQDAVTAQLLARMGRSPRMIFLFPIEVKDKLVCILYGDHGNRPISHRRLSELVLFCQDLPGAFEELMLSRKQGSTGARSALDFDHVVAPRLPPNATAWSPSTPEGQGPRGRAASTPGKMLQDAARPSSNFGPLLSRLTGTDAASRASAMAELARTPEASAQALAEIFPGPTAWVRTVVDALPGPEELGPVPTAMARLGRAGAHALAPLLDAPDAGIRYFALLTAGGLPFPELVGGVLRGLFDFDPDVSSAARAAAGALRSLPRLVASLSDLRLELAAKDPLRRSLAARALGVLHDRDSVDGLINLTGSDDEVCAQAAADGLREITRANHGSEPRRWAAWWAVNRGRTRAQWLAAALRNPELDVRLAAIEELSRALNDTLGYVADGPAAERENAVQRWEEAVMRIPRLRNMQ